MFFTVAAMGQRVASRLTVAETSVRAEVDLPPFLAAVRGQDPCEAGEGSAEDAGVTPPYTTVMLNLFQHPPVYASCGRQDKTTVDAETSSA